MILIDLTVFVSM